MKCFLRFLFLSLFVVTNSVWADTYFVDGAGQTVVDDDRAAAVELVQSAVVELGHQVTEDAAQADYSLRPKLIRLGSAYILKLEKRKAGQTVFSSQLKAQQAEELDRVAKRLTRAVLANQSAAENVRAGEVTNEEAREGTQRKAVLNGFYFALGPAILENSGTSGVGYSFSVAKAWDVNVAIIRLRGDFFGKGPALGLDMGLSGNYYFMNSDYSPFVGAELGFGGIRQNTGALSFDDFQAGFWLGPTAGIQLFRMSSVQLELGIKWSILLTSTTLGYPQYFAFRVGLYF